MATIAFCGLGMMGSAMAARLRDAGHDLRVWNRSREKAQAWAASGGTACDSPVEAARGASTAHLMLSDDAAVDQVLLGGNGLTQGLSRSNVIVDHSTVSVAGTKERAVRLERDGFGFLQAPVFGSPPNILRGEGLMVVGGSSRSYDATKPILAQILEKHFVVGEKPEDAAAFKLMGNLMLVTIVEGLAEAYAMAKANGISPSRAYGLFEHFNPCGTIGRRGPRMASGEYSPMFTLAMALKDVQLMLQAAGESNVVPALKTIESKLQRLARDGHAERDLAALGIDVVPPARGGDAH